MNYPKRSRPSGKQSGRLLLPAFLRDASVEILRLEYAVGVARPEAAVSPGQDADERITALVMEASPELRQKCRAFVLGYTLAPHAKWAPDEHGEATEGPTVAELEAHLRELADSGDRGAILAMLAALDPARYGPPGRVIPDSADTVDSVDFVPAVVTSTKAS